SALYTALYDAEGNLLVDYRPIVQEEKPLPKVIDGTKPVKEYKTNEELYLAGLRVDQFNNARLDYMDFYNEALLRDSMDARVNIEVGKHYIRQGKWEKAEQHLLRAQTRLSHDYTTVKNTEALYYLGYLYQMTDNIGKATDAYWAATWTPDFKHRSFYELAVLAVKDKDYKRAMDMIIQSLYVGGRDLQALTLKAYILRMQGKKEEAQETIRYIQQIDPLDYWSAAETNLSVSQGASFLKAGTNHNSKGIIAVQELLEVVNNYMTIGATEDALTLLNSAISLGEPYVSYPLLYYYKAYNLLKGKNTTEFQACLDKAASLSPLNNYPFRIEEIVLFTTLLQERPNDALLHYHLGNLLYYLGQKESGLEHWLHATEADPAFAIAARNVGFGYGCLNDLEKSMKYYDRAINANPNDPLLLTESDKIYEQANVPATQRLKRLESHLKTVMKHDDAVMRLLTLYNATAKYDKAIKIMDTRHFHLWEGGGQVHDIYVDSHMLKGMQLLKRKQYKEAIREFDLANQYPANLEVAPSPRGGYEAKVYYLSGIAYEAMKQADKARECFEKSAETHFRDYLTDLNYYKIKSLRKLNKNEKADAVLSNMQKTLERMQQNLMDSYAKFGEANQNVQQSNISYYSGLIHLLLKNPSAAKNDFNQAIQLYPGNIWAKLMNEDVH
ncbi:tetratricopeptide repeat protein, partial [Parabacteroides goldsteinii]